MDKKEHNVEILGRKIGMTQVYNENNELVPVTVVELGPCPVLQVKTTDTDGYNAVQIGFKPQKEHRISKALGGHFKKAGVSPVMHVTEFRTDAAAEFKAGEVLEGTWFEAGQKVDVISDTKGKGFQGVIKRHGYSGQPASHGSMSHRRPGSIGNCQWPGEVRKGQPMPGRMGNARRTAQNLEVVRVLGEQNLVLIKGSFPGANGSLLRVRKSVKGRK